MLTLKGKLSYFTSQKRVYLGTAENCNEGQTSYGKTIGKSAEQRKESSFTKDRGELEVQSVAFHCWSCDSLIGWPVKW